MFQQHPFTCRIEWGKRGAREAAKRGDITIIVDVLSFSSTVVTALHFGAIIYPYPPPINEQAANYANLVGAELLLGRAEAARLGKPSLSPVSFGAEHAGNKFVLCSLNGAACTWLASQVPALLVGSLLNASAVAHTANRLQSKTGANITVVPCGEHWNQVQADENGLRPAIEDYLGAGAILSKLDGSKSPEAQVCIGAFHSSESKIAELLWECGSGRELREFGFAEDVRHCSRLDVYQNVPILDHNFFRLEKDELAPTDQ
ncbi:2-phosphosulfolactate phosphatase [Brevibacillus ginsengisoli]|uniref:2-phosphosulfolactate phosphatase n=1 Tax=Brevibacillus ginsengisoli TaxID=363854 RepID=UPI003CE6BAB6